MKIPILLLFSLIQTCSAKKDDLPVILMDADHVFSHLNLASNPFAKISTSYFVDLVHDAIKKSECILIFVEDKLSPEDISSKDKLGTPYPRLHQGLIGKKIKYIPSVHQPYKTLTNIFHPKQQNVFYMSPGTKIRLPDIFKYLYIFFQYGHNDTRVKSLRKHDSIIQEVYFTVRQVKPGPIVAFYTGKINPISVETIPFIAIKPLKVPKDLGIVVASKGALFKFTGVYAATTTRRRATLNQIPMVAEETRTRSKMSTTMSYTDFELQFNFSFDNNNWLLDNVALLEGGEVVGRTTMDVGAPWNWSYVCGEPLTIMNTRDGSAITISKYQIQPTLKNLRRQEEGEEGGGEAAGGEDAGGEDAGGEAAEGEGAEGGGAGGGDGGGPSKSFGDAVDCCPYFNAHILSCLLIAFICLGALVFGVLMLYNCGSNDRFDDPHGKEVFVHTDLH